VLFALDENLVPTASIDTGLEAVGDVFSSAGAVVVSGNAYHPSLDRDGAGRTVTVDVGLQQVLTLAEATIAGIADVHGTGEPQVLVGPYVNVAGALPISGTVVGIVDLDDDGADDIVTTRAFVTGSGG
jgi:hypothetical protein